MRSRFFEQNTLEERIEIFRDYFDRDVESFFTSSVACCDACFDDFENEWPGTVARDIALQQGGIDIDTFLAQSRIQDAFYPEEIAAFAEHLTCPNCYSVLKGNFWIYEHPFSIPEDYNIRQISELARRSPFLLLSHPFARKVFDTINLLGASTTAGRLPQPLYRARFLPHNAQALLSDFGPPPASKVMEGRYNHAGHPMLYLAESEATATAEMGLHSDPHYIAALEFDLTARVLDLSFSDDIDGESQEIIQCLARSALCAAPRVSEGWDRPEYVFSRFVADSARHAGFTALRYGSVRDHEGANLVLLEPPGDFAQVRLVGVKMVAGK